MGKRARKTAGQDIAARKRKRKSNDDNAPGAAICNDVLDNIFVRLPTRTAVASMVLSKHHHRLICSPEFRSLHFRLSPPAPLPHPHIAYVLTAPTWRGNDYKPIGRIHSFHVAGGGLKRSNAPMRTLPHDRYLDMKYVNTCNGILLFARQTVPPTTCVLWNPAVADDEKEVTIPDTLTRSLNQSRQRWCLGPGDYVMSVLGLGYGRRTKSYKLLLLLWQQLGRFRNPPVLAYSKELLVYTLGTVREQPRRVALLRRDMCTEISQESLYINGTIYFPFENSVIIAFNVDDEEVTRIAMPAGSKRCSFQNPVPFKLVQMSDRPCFVKNNSSNITLWLLTEDHLWEQRWVFKAENGFSVSLTRVVWNYNGALLLYLHNYASGKSNHFSYDVATEKLLKENLSPHSVPKVSGYALCWGYRPTLVSPGSIVGELGPDEDGRCNRISGKPDNEQDRKNGQMTALNTIRFMESLIPILEKLSKTQDVV